MTTMLPSSRRTSSVTEPVADMGVTGNAQLLLGYIVGCLRVAEETRFQSPFYEGCDADAAAGTAIIRNLETGNTYRISVVQLERTE